MAKLMIGSVRVGFLSVSQCACLCRRSKQLDAQPWPPHRLKTNKADGVGHVEKCAMRMCFGYGKGDIVVSCGDSV